MKRYFNYFLLLAAFIATGWATGCKHDEPDVDSGKNPSFAVELLTVETNSATVKITSTAISEYAYLVCEKQTAAEPSETILFATGTTGKCADGEQTVTIPELNPLSEYVIYFGAKIDADKFYGTIVPVDVTTPDFSEDVAVFDVTGQSFKVRVKFPDSVTAAGNVLKWGTCDIVTYSQGSMFGPTLDADALNLSDEVYHNYFTESTTFTIDEEHMFVLDENGNPIPDESDMMGYLRYFDYMTPGQPQIFMLGEFTRGEHKYGFGEGWYVPLFDEERYWEENTPDVGPLSLTSADGTLGQHDYWTGFHKHIVFKTKEPEKLDAKLNVTLNLTPTGGTIRIDPDENVMEYAVALVDDDQYKILVDEYLGGDASLIQWYITSMNGGITLSRVFKEPVEIDLASDYQMAQDTQYHLFLTGSGDERLSTQCFEHHEFKLPKSDKPAPNIIVKPIDNPEGENTPYVTWFNIKCVNKDAFAAKYACNVDREWPSILKQYETYTNVVNYKGTLFTSSQMAEINSDAGMNIGFTTLPRDVLRLAVLGVNDEGVMEDIDRAESRAIAENQAISLPDAPRVESPLFNDLKGEWTATATVSTLENKKWVEREEPEVAKITIGEVTYPQTLSEDVYNLYLGADANMTREKVDALYADFKNECDIFNASVRGQNRLLCLGFGFAYASKYVDGAPTYFQMPSASPYDLFTMEDYGTYNNAGVLYDFGPKWYLQIDEQGNVTAPFNSNIMYPTSSWFDTYDYYLAAASASAYVSAPEDGSDSLLSFPVTVSADKNTITINPLVIKDENNKDVEYYPNLMWFSYGFGYFRTIKVSSAITLTRGWTGQTQSSISAANAGTVNLDNAGSVKHSPAARPAAKTSFAGETKQFKKVKMAPVTVESYKARIEELRKAANAR